MSDALHVSAGKDRSGRRLVVEGVVPLDRKVRPAEVDGRFFVYEHRDVGRGGPPRHLHGAQEEWIYVLAGEIVVEIGDRRLVLRPGDSALAPRGVPHAWANLGDAPASLLFLAQPAGTMEEFFETLSGRADLPWGELEAFYETHGITLLGPPLVAG